MYDFNLSQEYIYQIVSFIKVYIPHLLMRIILDVADFIVEISFVVILGKLLMCYNLGWNVRVAGT